jgi:hypothetical protein
MDLARKASFFTMDVITDIAFGSTWGCLTGDEDVGGWFEGTEQVMTAALWVSSFPILNKLLNIPFIARMIMPSDKDATGSGRLMGFVGTHLRPNFADQWQYYQKHHGETWSIQRTRKSERYDGIFLPTRNY